MTERERRLPLDPGALAPEALEIEPISDEALETVAGGTGVGPGNPQGNCRSMADCSWQTTVSV
ncbi:MAG TPA: hypothetical protein VHG91_06175 [Longimicrobium sp.]|nr:hypothetical protein [Longimicrobium sp.]